MAPCWSTRTACLRRVALICALICAVSACSDDAAPDNAAAQDAGGVSDVASEADTREEDVGDARDDAADASPPLGPSLAMDFAAADDLYAAPFPSAHRRRPDGGIDLSGLPGRDNALVAQLADLIEADTDGFGVSSGVWFRATEALDPDTLPSSLEASTAEDASVYLINVEPTSPGYLKRIPVTVRFEADGGPYGTPHQLSLLPLQGIVLHEEALHAAVVTRAVTAASGATLDAPPALEALTRGARPEGLDDASFARYSDALDRLEASGVALDTLAGLAVFRTGAPSRAMREARAMALAEPLPEVSTPELIERHAEFCAFEARTAMPVYQAGQPPFGAEGGGWARDASGALVRQRVEEARVFVTIPRAPMPDAGYPVAIFVRTGGGGDRPLIDRGVRGEDGGEPLEEGSGPAVQLARAGVAGVSADGPHGGIRNVNSADEQLVIFNIANPTALRDNIRQSALELVLLAHMLDAIRFDASACEGATNGPDGVARFDTRRLALIGHSMGATIGPLAIAVEPKIKAAVLSGAGGSWIENVLHKQRPLNVRPFAELILGYLDRDLHAHDPALNLLQWAGEPADPPIFARRIIHAPWDDAQPRHVLMFQGIADTYILPPIANTLTLALGLDLAGDALDATHPVAGQFTSIAPLLPLSGRRAIAYPAAGNLSAQGVAVTGVVVQHWEDGVEDGHEVMFQLDAPKRQYEGFLRTLHEGVPVVTDGAPP